MGIIQITPSDPPVRTASGRNIVPLLETGMTLTGPEFMRRFEAMPHVKKAELREGVAHVMTSPVRFKEHADPDGLAQYWLRSYKVARQGLQHGVNGTIYLGPDDIYQPDGMLFRFASDGGKVTLRDDGYLEGPPELIVEIAASSAWIDVGKKKETYRKFAVKEYIAWRTEEKLLDWWHLENGVYTPILPDADGIHKSRTLPGLWLDARALINADDARVLEVLHQGLASKK